MVEIELLDAEYGLPIQIIGGKPFYVGRAPTNDIVLSDEAVSSRHVAIWVASGRIWVEDLGSRNGTFVNDIRVDGQMNVPLDAELRLGHNTRFAIRGEPTPTLSEKVCVLEHTQTGVQYPFHSDRFTIGPRSESDIIVHDVPEITLLVEHAGAVYIGHEDGTTTPVAPGEVFAVGPNNFRIVEIDPMVTETHELNPARYPYTVYATLDGPTGPSARVTNTKSGKHVEIGAANRAVLLYVLAQQVSNDQAAGKSKDEAGWCFDEILASQIWGRANANSHRNNLAVLVCRTRADVRKGGLDPWFIEKRNRYIRLRATSIEIP